MSMHRTGGRIRKHLVTKRQEEGAQGGNLRQGQGRNRAGKPPAGLKGVLAAGRAKAAAAEGNGPRREELAGMPPAGLKGVLAEGRAKAATAEGNGPRREELAGMPPAGLKGVLAAGRENPLE